MKQYQNFFENCTSVEEIKTRYRTLAKKYHPDLGGDLFIMQRLNQQYHKLLQNFDGQETEGHKYKYQPDIEQELMDVIHELLKIQEIQVALIGYWIWVSGNTKPNKNTLKTLGLSWHSKRKCWYYKPKDWQTQRRNSKCSLQELAAKYGYKHFQSDEQKALPAQ